MKWITALLLALLLSPLMALAEKPSTQPSHPGKGEGAYARQQNMKRDGFMPGMKPTQAELDEALSFMKDTAPHHLELFNRLPEGGPRRAHAEQIMVMRYHNLMRMKDQNPDAYDAMLEQWKLEDEAIGFAQASREKTQPDADVRLREVVRRMVQKSLDVRRERIEKLRKLLEEQQKQLDQDEQNKEKLMKQQVAEALNKFERLFGTGGKDRGPIDQGDGFDGKDMKNALTK